METSSTKKALALRRGLSLATAALLAALGAAVAAGGAQAAEPIHVPIPGGLGGKTCFECHIKGSGPAPALRKRPRSYTIREAWETYLETPHGRLRRLGDARAPTCEDCHYTREWKDILPADHEDSPIHPKNLPRLCARCHGPGLLTANVAKGSMHLELAHRSFMPGGALPMRYGFLPGITKREGAYFLGPFDVIGLVNWFFVVITVGTLSAFSLIMLLDLFRKLAERRGSQTPGTNDENPS